MHACMRACVRACVRACLLALLAHCDSSPTTQAREYVSSFVAARRNAGASAAQVLLPTTYHLPPIAYLPPTTHHLPPTTYLLLLTLTAGAARVLRAARLLAERRRGDLARRARDDRTRRMARPHAPSRQRQGGRQGWPPSGRAGHPRLDAPSRLAHGGPLGPAVPPWSLSGAPPQRRRSRRVCTPRSSAGRGRARTRCTSRPTRWRRWRRPSTSRSPHRLQTRRGVLWTCVSSVAPPPCKLQAEKGTVAFGAVFLPSFGSLRLF